MPLFDKPNSSKKRTCEYCGKTFEPKAIQPPQRFCSHACYAESIRKIQVTKEELEHWYFALGMTSIEIAKQLGCNDRHVRAIMAQYGIQLRDRADAAIDYLCRPFSGDAIEKAYMLAFRLGDLNVRKDLDTSKRIQVRSSSTVSAQVELICALFAPYGHINLRTGLLGETQIECRLDSSFEFLLPKQDAMPNWAKKDDACFWAFTAGYLDAEGHIGIKSAGTHWDVDVEIASCDVGILQDIHSGLEKRSISCTLRDKGKTKTGREYYCLTIARKSSLDMFFRNIHPLSRHAEKRLEIARAWARL